MQVCKIVCMDVSPKIEGRPTYIHTYICRYIAISIDLYINQVAIHIEMRLKSRNAHSISWRRGHPGSGCLRMDNAQDLRQCDLCITECLLHVCFLIIFEVRKQCRMILSKIHFGSLLDMMLLQLPKESMGARKG